MALNYQIAINQLDLERISALAQEIWTEHYTPIIGAAQVTFMLEMFHTTKAIQQQIEHGVEYYLIFSDDDPVGYLAIKLMDDHRFFLSKLYLLARCRGLGFGRQSIEFIKSRAEDVGATSIFLTVNKTNFGTIAAYERMGFVRTRALVTDIGGGFVMDDWEYELTL